MQFLVVDDHSIVTMALEMLLKDYDGQDNSVFVPTQKKKPLHWLTSTAKPLT